MMKIMVMMSMTDGQLCLYIFKSIYKKARNDMKAETNLFFFHPLTSFKSFCLATQIL